MAEREADGKPGVAFLSQAKAVEPQRAWLVGASRRRPRAWRLGLLALFPTFHMLCDDHKLAGSRYGDRRRLPESGASPSGWRLRCDEPG
jgi:hypothetical protein